MAKKGFTIIELLIVITVLAILIAMAIPRFTGIREEGNIARAKGELRTLLIAVEGYLIHTKKLPESLSVLVDPATNPNLIGASLPQDPFLDPPGDFGYKKSGQYYCIWSVGPGGGGSCNVTESGEVSESDGDSCIYVTNGKTQDVKP